MDPSDTARQEALDALNGAFDRIFVITLKRAAARQARAAEALRGLRYELHLGADRLELDFDALERDGLLDQRAARRHSRLGRPLKPGEVGCALSHRQIWEAIVRNGWRRVLILEDDAVPDPAGFAQAPAALAELPDDFDLAYLYWSNFERVTLRHRLKQATYLLLSALRLMKWTPREILRFHPRPFSAHLRRAGLHHGTVAYAVSAAGARRLLEAQTPVAHPSDQLMLRLILRGQLAAYIAVPKIFGHDHAAAAAGDPVSFRRE